MTMGGIYLCESTNKGGVFSRVYLSEDLSEVSYVIVNILLHTHACCRQIRMKRPVKILPGIARY